MLRAALGLKASCAYAEALREVERAESSLLADRAGLIAAVDAATAAALLGDPQAIALYARLLSEKADLERRTGGLAAAQATERRLHELLRAAQTGPAKPDLP